MTTLLQSALKLADIGFFVFPVKPNGKTPAIDNWQNFATREKDQIKLWWAKKPDYNIGVYTEKFGIGEALIAVDVDNKGDKKGDEAILGLDFSLPKTFEQITPTGGRHLVYRVKEAVKQGVSVLGPGLDIRSKGGYIVGAGSIIDGKLYQANPWDLAEAPEELIFKCKKPRVKTALTHEIPDINRSKAMSLAQKYLNTEAELAVEGSNGDQATYIVACKVKDFGVNSEDAFQLIAADWNPRCSPPWELNQLKNKVENAYKYGTDAIGSANPEVIFKDVPVTIEKQRASDPNHPIIELNKQYAFIIIGGKSYVLHEYRNEASFLTVQAFQHKLLPQVLLYSDKKHQLADLWLRSPLRRSFEGVCFAPGEGEKEYYNFWRGFSFSPNNEPSAEAKESVELFLDHTLENICDGDFSLYTWLINWCADIIQNPATKPGVATVFKGLKGVGKNIFIETIGRLFESNFTLVSNARFVTGNFNSHFERCLLMVFDEAFYSGDKQAEGKLKDLITGTHHVIERKGMEPYKVKNYTRLAILGNEDWLVPASFDERRFAVFTIASNRRNDREYFGRIKDGMKKGGYEYLLSYLQNYKISVDVSVAPNTPGLMNQKVRSLEPFYAWWFECLKEGKIVGADFSGEWEQDLECERLRIAYRNFCNDRNIKRWGETDNQIGVLLRACLPQIRNTQKHVAGVRVRTYVIPDLIDCRKEWDNFIGGPIDWPVDDELQDSN